MLSSERFLHWRRLELSERIGPLKQLSKLLLEKKEGLARMASLEMGKPLVQSEGEIEKCAWLCDHYAEHAEAYLANEPVEIDAAKAWVAYEPMGVILGIMPWNFPYWQALRFALPTILAGNVVLLKHAPNVQGCAEALEALMLEAGFPESTFTNIPIPVQYVSGLIEHPDVMGVSLTGSERAGKAVGRAAGEALKPSLLELGGSNAFIVLADADIEKSVDLGMSARLQNNGQSCIAAKRFILEASIADDFVDCLLEKLDGISIGDPLDRITQLGPLARVDLAENLQKQVLASIRKGASKLHGAEVEGAMYPATVLDKLAPGMPAFDEETFGPVFGISRVSGAEEAAYLANSTRYGLGVSICTADVERALGLGKKLKDGALFINEMVKSHPALPFGGSGISGYGRELGSQGIRAFCNVKTYYQA